MNNLPIIIKLKTDGVISINDRGINVELSFSAIRSAYEFMIDQCCSMNKQDAENGKKD